MIRSKSRKLNEKNEQKQGRKRLITYEVFI
jgi:hypothetical protein